MLITNRSLIKGSILLKSYNSEYIWFVFSILSHYCSILPVYRKRVRYGKINWIIDLITRSLPCFSELYSLFYVNKVKVIPKNIYELLTPVAFAHFIMGDGHYKSKGLTLCTDSYSIEDVVPLNVCIIYSLWFKMYFTCVWKSL